MKLTTKQQENYVEFMKHLESKFDMNNPIDKWIYNYIQELLKDPRDHELFLKWLDFATIEIIQETIQLYFTFYREKIAVTNWNEWIDDNLDLGEYAIYIDRYEIISDLKRNRFSGYRTEKITDTLYYVIDNNYFHLRSAFYLKKSYNKIN
jgi:hypothetical protein